MAEENKKIEKVVVITQMSDGTKEEHEFKYAFIGGVLNESKIEVKDGIVGTCAAVMQLGSSSLPERVGVAKALISNIDLAEVLIGGLLVSPGEMTREMGEDTKEES